MLEKFESHCDLSFAFIILSENVFVSVAVGRNDTLQQLQSNTDSETQSASQHHLQ